MANKDTVDQIRNRMMRGLSDNTFVATQEQKDVFLNEHLELIEWVLARLPRSSCISSAVPAALAKSSIRYGRDVIDKFCEVLRDGTFTGEQDPVHLLWKLLLRSEGKNRKTTDIYGKTLCAINAFVDGKKAISSLRVPRKDIFKWDINYTPKISRRNERQARKEQKLNSLNGPIPLKKIKMRVNLEDYLQAQHYLDSINEVELEQIEFFKDGQPIAVDAVSLKSWNLMSNTLFIEHKILKAKEESIVQFK